MTDQDLKTRFDKELRPSLMKELGIKNVAAAPRPLKVVLNVGIPKSDSSTKDVETIKA